MQIILFSHAIADTIIGYLACGQYSLGTYLCKYWELIECPAMLALKLLQTYQEYNLINQSITMCKINSQNLLEFADSPMFSIESATTLSSLCENLLQDGFRLPQTAQPRSLKRCAPEILEAVMDWFGTKGISKGKVQGLVTEEGKNTLKKVASTREKSEQEGSQLLVRRMRRKLTITL